MKVFFQGTRNKYHDITFDNSLFDKFASFLIIKSTTEYSIFSATVMFGEKKNVYEIWQNKNNGESKFVTKKDYQRTEMVEYGFKIAADAYFRDTRPFKFEQSQATDLTQQLQKSDTGKPQSKFNNIVKVPKIDRRDTKVSLCYMRGITADFLIDFGSRTVIMRGDRIILPHVIAILYKLAGNAFVDLSLRMGLKIIPRFENINPFRDYQWISEMPKLFVFGRVSDPSAVPCIVYAIDNMETIYIPSGVHGVRKAIDLPQDSIAFGEILNGIVTYNDLIIYAGFDMREMSENARAKKIIAEKLHNTFFRADTIPKKFPSPCDIYFDSRRILRSPIYYDFFIFMIPGFDKCGLYALCQNRNLTGLGIQPLYFDKVRGESLVIVKMITDAAIVHLLAKKNKKICRFDKDIFTSTMPNFMPKDVTYLLIPDNYEMILF